MKRLHVENALANAVLEGCVLSPEQLHQWERFINGVQTLALTVSNIQQMILEEGGRRKP